MKPNDVISVECMICYDYIDTTEGNHKESFLGQPMT